MAGSKKEKRGGLSVKNWASVYLLLHWTGWRVNTQKEQGLFSKNAGLKQYAQISAIGSRSGGSARRRTRLLIRRVDLRSNGQERLGARAAAEGRR